MSQPASVLPAYVPGTKYTVDVKALRRQHGVSLSQLIQRTGAPVQTVQAWNRGACPSTMWLPALAACFGVDVKELFTELTSEGDAPGAGSGA